ncbi:MAG: hypothetical protein V3U76_20855 [Granulosicoccus sp.]
MRTINRQTLKGLTDMRFGNNDREAGWKLNSVLALSVSLALGGCSMISGLTTNTAAGQDAMQQLEQAQNHALDPVALNFTKIITQIDGLQPPDATMRFYDATYSSLFNQSLGKAMQAAGYNVEKVSNPEVANLVSHSVQQNVSLADGEKYIYEVSVGGVGLRRGFVVVDDGTLMPATKMQIMGVEPGNLEKLEKDDSMF